MEALAVVAVVGIIDLLQLDFDCWLPCLFDADWKLLRTGIRPFLFISSTERSHGYHTHTQVIGRIILIPFGIILVAPLQPSRQT